MTAYSWILGSGDWNSANNWSPSGGPPTSADSATISATGSAYTITVDSADAANSLTLSSADATVNDTGTLTIGGAFSFSAGTFNIGLSSTPGSLSVGGTFTLDGGALNVDDGTLGLGGVLTDSAGSITLASGGTISGGTLDVTGGAFNWNGGTLSGVTYEGTLNLTASGATGVVANGLTMAGSNGTGPGTINITGEDVSLYFDNTQTFDGATINLGSAINYAPSYLYENDVSGAGNQVLTLGSGVTIDVQGYGEIYAGGYSGDGIVSEGVINVTTTGAALMIAGAAFTNTGTINDTGGGLSIQTANFTNQGTIDVADGQTLTVPNGTTFTNATGTISLDGTSSLIVNEALTTAQFGTVDAASGATLDFAAGLNNTGATLQVGAGVVVEGSIDGGTIDGAINLTATSQTLSFSGGPTVDNAAGTGPGTINVTGEDAYLYFDNTQTFDGATINLGSAINYAPSYLYENDVSGAGDQVLTLGSGVTIDIQGYAEIYAGAYSGDGIVSEGVINVTTTGAPLTIAGAAFTNTGTINDTGGGLSIETADFTNQGTIDVADGQTLTVPNGTTFTNATGTISLDGTSSLVLDEALTTAQLGTVDAASGATLDFAAGLDNVGATLQVGSGVVVEGSIEGGTIDGAINLTATGQTLTFSDGPTADNASGTGPGTINVTGESAYLYFDNTQTFDGATINLGNTIYYYAPSYLYENDVSGAGDQVLTLGSGVTIDIQGYAEIYAGAYSGDGIVSEGVINVTTTGAPLTIAGAAFTNTGTINDTSGGLSIETADFTNQGTIDVADGQTLTVPNGTTFTNATGTISLDGTSSLVLDEALTTAQLGTVDAASGATLDFAAGLDNVGATLQVGSGVVVEGSIEGGTIDGAINLTATGQTLTFSDGPTVDNASGTGPGTINVTGESAYLYFDNTQTFDGATINLGNTIYYYAPSYLYENDVSGGGDQVLTLGSGVTIDIQGYAEIYAGAYSGDGIVSEGVINVTTTGAPLTIAGAAFTNTGTINDTGGGLSIETADFTNQGTIDVADGQTLTVPNGTTFTNATGTISLDGTSSLVLDEVLTTAQLGTVNAASGATLDFAGGLDNTGAILQVGTGVVLEGTIDGGTIDGAINFGAGGALTIDGGTVDGAINLTASGESLTLVGGPTVDNASGAGPGTITVTGAYDSLVFDNTQTFNNATINLGNASGYYDYLYESDVSGAGNQVVTLGSGVTINIEGSAEIEGGGYSGDAIVNDGVINDTTAGSYLYLYDVAFTNSGTFNDTESGGVGLSMQYVAFTNTGTVNVENGQSFYVPTYSTLANSGTINVDGTSSLVLDEVLTTAQLGTVNAASGATLDFAGGLDNTGAILQVGTGVVLEGTIDGGTIDGAINFGAGGALTIDGGTVDGAINLTASGESLTLVGGPTVDNASGAGPGTITVTGAYDSLVFDNTQTFNNATINLGNASGYYDYLYESDVSGAGNQVVTLGSGVTINIEGSAEIEGGGYSGDAIVNDGVINDTTAVSYLYLYDVAFTNSGTFNDTESGVSMQYVAFINAGVINVGDGGQFNISGAFTNNTAGEITGSGAVSGALTNNGLIDANGGDLDFTAAITGSGRLQIEAGSELELGAATGEAATFAATTGKLRIDDPSSANYTGTISDFGGSDILELANTNATSVTPGTFNGATTTLTVNLNGGGALTYTLAGDYSSDNFALTHVNGNADSDIALGAVITGTPSIAAPATATVGVGQPGAVSGISIAESPTTSSETFTVTLADANGLLSATGSGVSGSGTTSLSIAGSLAQVNSDLATLSDSDSTTPSDTITINASDSNGGTATPASIAVTINGLPALTAPTTATVVQNQASAISGVGLAESGDTAGESFTVTLADTSGDLSATGTGVSGSGTTSLTITGSLSQVNSDLATLSDTDAAIAADTITLNASDSFGNSAAQQSISVTVAPQSGTPAIAAPTAATVGVGQPGAISG